MACCIKSNILTVNLASACGYALGFSFSCFKSKSSSMCALSKGFGAGSFIILSNV